MKSVSIQSRRDGIAIALAKTRQQTLDLCDQVKEAYFFEQAHPEFSPIGWHLGHIAFTEELWIIRHLADLPASLSPDLRRLFAADALPKKERKNLPSQEIIQGYLKQIRTRTLSYLRTCSLGQQEKLWRWLIQHESQHCETISFLWQLHQQRDSDIANVVTSLTKNAIALAADLTTMVQIKAGAFTQGSDHIEALDNEGANHQAQVNTFWIDSTPVTCGQYAWFMIQGGYQERKYWSLDGWQWLQKHPVNRPLYWCNHRDWANHPVCGVNYYEAEAYANFVNKRLPTEAEWEKAATGASSNGNHSRLIGHTTAVNTYNQTSNYGCRDMLGNVWEWTTSNFEPYPGFMAYPYPGYSAVYFDGQHKVLRGGSWATGKISLRTSFRNWYHPEVRQIFAGFRCVQD